MERGRVVNAAAATLLDHGRGGRGASVVLRVLLLLAVIVCAAASRRRRCRRFHPVDVWRSVRRKQTSGQGRGAERFICFIYYLDVSL